MNIGPRTLAAAGVTPAEAQAAFVATREVAPVLVTRLRAADQAILNRQAARMQAELRIRAGFGSVADCVAVRQTAPIAIAERNRRDAILAEATATFLAAVPATRRAELAASAAPRPVVSPSDQQTSGSLSPRRAGAPSQAPQRTVPANSAPVAPDPALTLAWRNAILQGQ
jgi:hypothetical protein